MAFDKIPNDEVYKFEVLGGRTYSHSERPVFWRNEISLRFAGVIRGNPRQMSQLPLADFPRIDDFEVWLEKVTAAGVAPFGFQVHFYSASRGYIASFPWWDHGEHDLIRDDFQIPLGDFQNPVYDLEQGWEIFIAADADFVYVLQGDFDAPIEDGYYAWFKVKREAYIAAWQKAIALCHKTFQS